MLPNTDSLVSILQAENLSHFQAKCKIAMMLVGIGQPKSRNSLQPV
jgi:hypothetical protein